MQHWTHLLFLEIITLLQTTDEWSVLESSQLIPCRIHCFPGLAFTINFTNKISSPMPLHASSRHWDVTSRNIIIYLGSASDWKILNIGLTPIFFLFLQIADSWTLLSHWDWGHTTYNIAAPAVGYHPSIKLLKYIIGTLLRISGNTNPSDSGGHRLDNVIIKCLLQG